MLLDHSLKIKKKIIKKIKETGDSRYIYQNKLDKACFQHNMAYGDFQDLIRRAIFDKVFCDGINVEVLQWFIKFLIKKLLVEQLKIKIIEFKNYTSQLLENLRKEKYTCLL